MNGNTSLKMLDVLARAELLNLLSSKQGTLKNMPCPDKTYCDNLNIMTACKGHQEALAALSAKLKEAVEGKGKRGGRRQGQTMAQISDDGWAVVA